MRSIEVFELKNSPDVEMDRLIISLSKKGYIVRKVNMANSDEMKRHPEITEMLKSGKNLPLIKYNGKVINKTELKRLATF